MAADPNVNQKDNKGRSPLFIAVGFTHSGYIVDSLLEAGAIIDSPDECGRTPLMQAVHRNKLSVIELLIERKALVDIKDHSGRTALSYAAERGCLRSVKILLSKGADIDTQDDDGTTPLCYAAKIPFPQSYGNGFLDSEIRVLEPGNMGELAVGLLLQEKATRDIKNKDGWTALWFAIDLRNLTAMRLLLDDGSQF